MADTNGQRPSATEQFMQLHLGFAPSRIMAAAIQLDVFSHIAAGKKTVAAVAKAAGASERGMRMLLDSLTGMQFLRKRDSTYRLSAAARRYLVASAPDYCGAMLGDDRLWNSWTHLTEVIRNGKAAVECNERKAAESFFPMLVQGLHVTSRSLARRLAGELLDSRRSGGLEVLDVACGSGVWGIARAEADRAVRVTAHDFPKVLELTRQYAARHGVEKRFSFLDGDLSEVDFGTRRFDVALLGHIVHSEGADSSRRLFRKVYKALKPGGRIVIIDMLPNDQRTAPPFPLLFALVMLVHTECGDTYTFKEYRSWLRQAGFDRVAKVNIGSHSPTIVATRR